MDQWADLGLSQHQVEEDLSFLRDQIITTEVNIARIFNFDVRRRRKVGLQSYGGSRVDSNQLTGTACSGEGRVGRQGAGSQVNGR